MHARQIGPPDLGAKPYVRQKSQIVFVGAGYRVLLAATDANQRPVNGPSRSLAAAAYRSKAARIRTGYLPLLAGVATRSQQECTPGQSAQALEGADSL